MIFPQLSALQEFAKSEEWKTAVDGIWRKVKIIWSTAEKIFLNADSKNLPEGVEGRTLSWSAFPKKLEKGGKKYEAADVREKQDEYCEWFVEKDSENKITRVVFTSEMIEVFVDFL